MGKPITVHTHFGVRNAWYGEEMWQTWSHHPATLIWGRELKRKRPWYYRFWRKRWDLAGDEYARIDVWLPLWATHNLNQQWWRLLGILHRHGLIRSNQPIDCVTRFRDIRLGRDKPHG